MGSDLLEGHNEWRNVQDVIRSAFKLVHDVSLAQSLEISKLKEELSTRPTRSEINDALSKLARTDEISVMTSNLDAAIKDNAEACRLHSCLFDKVQNELDEHKDKLQSLNSIVNIDASANPDFHIVDSIQECVRKVRFLEDEVRRKVDRGTLYEYATVEAMKKKASLIDLDRKADMSILTEMVRPMATKEFVQAGLDTKANKRYVDDSLGGKVDRAVFTSAVKGLPTKKEVSDLLLAKCGALESKIEDTTLALNSCANKSSLVDIMTTLDRKADAAETARHLSDKVCTSDFVAGLQDKLTESDMEDHLELMAAKLTKKTATAILKLQQDLVAVLNKKAYSSDVKRVVEKLARKEDLSALKLLNNRIESVENSLQAKVNQAVISEMTNNIYLNTCDTKDTFRKTHEHINHLSESLDKINTDAWQEPLLVIRKQLEDMVTCSKLKEALTLKADKDAVEVVVRGLATSLKKYAMRADLSHVEESSMQLRQLVEGELGVGRWVWKSGQFSPTVLPIDSGAFASESRSRTIGETSYGGYIQWNVQSANITPSNLLWTPGSTNVTCISGGFYELILALYSRDDEYRSPSAVWNVDEASMAALESEGVERRCSIHVQVNGATIRREVRRYGGSIRHRLAEFESEMKADGEGNITCNRRAASSLVDYVHLPPKAQVAIICNYNGDVKRQPFHYGFFSLRRLAKAPAETTRKII